MVCCMDRTGASGYWDPRKSEHVEDLHQYYDDYMQSTYPDGR